MKGRRGVDAGEEIGVKVKSDLKPDVRGESTGPGFRSPPLALCETLGKSLDLVVPSSVKQR